MPAAVQRGPVHRALEAYRVVLFWAVQGLSAVSAAAVMALLVVVCADVTLRAFGAPIVGALDLTKCAGTVALACALPYTTAVKGHVAIEYFFHKLGPRARIAVDSLVRLFGMTLFGGLAYGSALRGIAQWGSGEVSPTLRLPMFWIPWLLAACCALTLLVILYHLLHPGRTLVKP